MIWVANDHRPDPARDVPTIVVEFVSTGKAAWRRDFIDKRDEYLESGIAEYWVIDRFQRTLTVFTLENGVPIEKVVQEGEIYHAELLPGFELPLKDLLIAADKWDAASEPPRD